MLVHRGPSGLAVAVTATEAFWVADDEVEVALDLV